MAQNKRKGIPVSQFVSAAKSIMNDDALAWEVQDIASSLIAATSSMMGMDVYHASFVPSNYHVVKVVLYDITKKDALCSPIAYIRVILPNGKVQNAGVMGCPGEFSYKDFEGFRYFFSRLIKDAVPIEITDKTPSENDQTITFRYSVLTTTASAKIAEDEETQKFMGGIGTFAGGVFH